jgi:hypothetical protein
MIRDEFIHTSTICTTDMYSPATIPHTTRHDF